MHNTTIEPREQTQRGNDNSLAPPQELAILDSMRDGVFVAKYTDGGYILHYFNRSMAELFNNHVKIADQPLSELFGRDDYSKLCVGLEKVRLLHTNQELQLDIGEKPHRQQYQVQLSPQNLSPLGENNDILIIGCILDTGSLTNRVNYLETRAAKLVDHAKNVEATNHELKNEITRFRRALTKLERTANYDSETGLPNRAHYLERGSAEFQRSLRYGHSFSIVVANIHGFNQIVHNHGESSGKKAMAGLAQICESAFRGGIDIAGRIGQTEIAVLLPETSLTGALIFVDRLRSLIAETPIQLNDSFIRLGIHTGTDCIQENDHSFLQCLGRATRTS